MYSQRDFASRGWYQWANDQMAAKRFMQRYQGRDIDLEKVARQLADTTPDWLPKDTLEKFKRAHGIAE